MRRAALAVALGSVLPVAAAAADLSVSYQEGRLDVSARAPLADVLDRIGRQTGMKVVYDGAAPRMIVATELKGVTPARAVRSLLEGQNLGYAAITDASGTKVTMLVLVGSGGSTNRSASASSPAARPAPPPDPSFDEESTYEEPFPEPEQAEPEPEPQAKGEGPMPDAPAAAPAPGLPPGWPGAPPQMGQPGVFTPFPQPSPPSPDAQPEEPKKE
jgi:hypothetical protein